MLNKANKRFDSTKEERYRTQSFNIGDSVRLAYSNVYGIVTKVGVISKTGNPLVEVTWVTKLSNEGESIKEFKPYAQNCYKESLILWVKGIEKENLSS